MSCIVTAYVVYYRYEDEPTINRGGKMRYEIRSNSGKVLSRHHTREAAEMRMQKNLAWSKNKRTCSAEHYTDKIVQIA